MFKRLTHMTISPSRLGGLVAAIAWLALAASAAAQDMPAEVPPQDAAQVLDTAAATVAPDSAPADAEPAADATIALHDLAVAYPELQGADRESARSLLQRPTDTGGSDQFNEHYPPAAPIASASSQHFCVFWINAPVQTFDDAPSLTDANGVTDGDGVPDFVESLLDIAEHSYSVEVAPGEMGWKAPKPDKQGCGNDPSARSDIYLKELGNQGLFGYQTVDPGQGRSRSQYGYMVLDNDYAESEYGYADPTIPASVTFAHEFNHLLQMNYDAFQDTWFLEATATWSEEHVFPDVNDWLNYVNVFAKFPGEPVTATFPPAQEKSLRIYGAATLDHWLDVGGGGFGSGVIRKAWEASTKVNPPDYALAALDKAIKKSGGKGFSQEFVPFAAATAEWRAGAGGNLPDHPSYPDVKRNGSLKKGGKKTFELDHTAYRLLNVKPTGGRELTLKAELEDGVAGGLALVARTGDPLSGQAKQKVKYLGDGGKGSVTLDDPGRFDRITAVLVNADDGVRGFAGGDWVYAKDKSEFKARLTG